MKFEKSKNSFDEGYKVENEMSEADKLRNLIADSEARLDELTLNEENIIEGGRGVYHIYKTGRLRSGAYYASFRGRSPRIFLENNVKTCRQGNNGFYVWRKYAGKYMKFTVMFISEGSPFTTYYYHYNIFCY